MKHNIGTYDAAIRAVVGFGALIVGNHCGSWWGLLGLVPILTGLLACCPLYTLLHIDTQAWDDAWDHHGPPSSWKNV